MFFQQNNFNFTGPLILLSVARIWLYWQFIGTQVVHWPKVQGTKRSCWRSSGSSTRSSTAPLPLRSPAVQWTDVATHLTGQAHIATVRADGSPHVAKVWPALDGQTIWIGTRATSGKARNLRVNPEAALMFEPAGEAYVSGDVELISDLPTKRRIWDSGIFPYPLAGFFGAPTATTSCCCASPRAGRS